MTKFFIDKKISALMLFLLILVIGSISIKDLKTELLPNITFPTLTIITVYENASPNEIETLISRPIEEIVSSVGGVDRITSESLEGVSLVKIRFRWGVDMDSASIQTREKVDLVKGSLPIDAKKSIVLKFDPNDRPILQYAVIAKGTKFKELRFYLEKNIVPYFERIDGIAAVSVTGGYEKQILVNLDRAKLQSYNISSNEIIQSINSNNFNFPAGNIKRNDREVLVRTMGSYESVTDIENLVIGVSESGYPIYLNNIASVIDSYKERTSSSFYNDEECVALVLKKEAGKNSIIVAKETQEMVDFVNKEFGKSINLILVSDQSKYIEDSIQGVAFAGFQSIIICFFVLSFFLGTFKESGIVTLSIPLSILISIILMYFNNMTLNTMSLGGLAVGVGMMVDSSIVTLESIFVFRNQGYSRFDSAIKGTEDVIGSLFSSTLTSIVVFLPVLFIDGIAASIFKEFALAITFSLISSLFVSISFLPLLSTLPFFVGEKSSNENIFFRFRDRILTKLENHYEYLIRFFLKRRKLLVSIVVLLVPLTIFFFMILPSEMMPEAKKKEVNISLLLPPSTSIEETTVLANKVFEILRSSGHIDSAFMKNGFEERDIVLNPKADFGLNMSEINISLESYNKLDPLIDETYEMIRNLEKEYDAEITFLPSKDLIGEIIPDLGSGLTLEISGNDLYELKKVSEDITDELNNLDWVDDVSTSFNQEIPEIRIIIDRDKMATFGLNIETVSTTLRSYIRGDEASRFRIDDNEIPILVRNRLDDRSGIDSISSALFKLSEGKFIRLSDFATVLSGKMNRKILRYDGKRVGLLNIQFSGINISSAFLKIQPYIDKYRENSNITILPGESRKLMEKSINSMIFATLLSILFVYMVLASNMENLLLPLIILFSIFISGIGVAFGLLITGLSINIISVMGIILLAGIVVNSAIILIEYYQGHESESKDVKELVIAGGKRRLSPILSTALTTILGLLPLLISWGPPSPQAPMAAAVMGGLIVSTFLTLIFVPVTYSVYVDRIKRKK